MSNKDNILKLNANRSTEMTLNPSLLMFFFWGGGVPLGIFGRGVPPVSPNPEPISYETM